MFPKPHFVDSNGIRLAVYEQGAGPAVIMVHGFPELAYSWRHQLLALAAAGYRAIAPDMRGYGQSDVPAGVDAYRVTQLIADLKGLLDALDIERATFVGHDWGALVLWHMALLAPDRVLAVVPEQRKAEAVRAALQGPVTPACPASILRTQPHVTIYLDQESASLVT